MARFMAFKPPVDEPKKKGRLKRLGKVMTRAKNVLLNVFSPKRAQQTQNRWTRDLFHPSIHRRLSFRYPRSRTDSNSSLDSLLSDSSSICTFSRKRKAESISETQLTQSSSKPCLRSSITSTGDHSSPCCEWSPPLSCQQFGHSRSCYIPVDEPLFLTDFRSETALQEVQLTPFLMDSPAKPKPPKKRRRLNNFVAVTKDKVENNQDLDDTIHNITMTMPTVQAQPSDLQ
ncbi:unnamed protein product [Bursaphelenchus xylophilus]|uniref:(pine wood nematode) hypothetical protein n=1 Tax=Bursaphelenchus xylophilus TaxID=6326 RepID=A0A1I7RP50_BURXY|nr:unnamed protein product [Bursaphelenchus xylophilus]CAG9124556.1 unnamed protein product [Bursaphelenchus xylophilus]